ncbi:MAG: hypothetical protein ACI4K7_00380 [Oscillospiraceae bacterium]
MKVLDMTSKEFIRRAVFLAVLMAVLAVIMFILYAIVYERCYNIMNADEMIVFRLYENSGDIFVVFFNKLYKLF